MAAVQNDGRRRALHRLQFRIRRHRSLLTAGLASCLAFALVYAILGLEPEVRSTEWP